MYQELKCFTGSHAYNPHGNLSGRHCYEAYFPEEETEAQRAQYYVQGTALKVAGMNPGHRQLSSRAHTPNHYTSQPSA